MHRKGFGNYKPQNTYFPELALADGSRQGQILSTYLPVHIKGPQVSQCWGTTSSPSVMTNLRIKQQEADVRILWFQCCGSLDNDVYSFVYLGFYESKTIPCVLKAVNCEHVMFRTNWLALTYVTVKTGWVTVMPLLAYDVTFCMAAIIHAPGPKMYV